MTSKELITQLYVGYFDRAPDPEGLAFWITVLDDGLSLDAIAQDFAKLKKSNVVVFDDYYLDGADIEAFGCNKVIDSLPHLILPMVDRFSNGLAIALAVVASPERLAEIGNLYPHAIGKHI